MHKTLLVEKSEYFKSCFNVELLESRSNHVRLPEDDPKAFDCFVSWAYTGRVTANMSIEDCIKAYILADKLICPRQYLLDIVTHFYNAAERRQITLKQVQSIVDSGLTESDLMDAAIVELANAVKADWPAFEKDEAWRTILAADAGLTLRVLAGLRTSWTRDAGGGGASSKTARARTGASTNASGSGREKKRKAGASLDSLTAQMFGDLMP